MLLASSRVHPDMRTAAFIATLGLVQPDAGPSLDTLLDRLSAYLVGYEKAISEVIADEEMTQTPRSMSSARAARTTPAPFGDCLPAAAG